MKILPFTLLKRKDYSSRSAQQKDCPSKKMAEKIKIITMPILNIITIPKDEKKLRQKSKELDPDLIIKHQKFFGQLAQAMFQANGLGLAAPQVGEQIRVIAISIGNQAHIFINPKITKRSFFKDSAEEGCLSIPGKYGQVKRHKKITLEYLDKNNKFHKQKFNRLTARIIQHETDHLDGILFIDKLV